MVWVSSEGEAEGNSEQDVLEGVDDRFLHALGKGIFFKGHVGDGLVEGGFSGGVGFQRFVAPFEFVPVAEAFVVFRLERDIADGAWTGDHGIFHAMENFPRIFPHHGKKVSTVWKIPGWFFHGMETSIAFFPRHGKKFSTVWKIWNG
ncbi:MAG: hypothetical protein GX548_02475 [Lentisphaerae bacterium]|nr:hypothetical protein [Lentisphaerota bacterium]